MSPTKQAKSQWRQRRREAKKATVARNQNSIRWQNGEKNLGRTQAQSGGQSSFGQRTNSVWLWVRQHNVRSQMWSELSRYLSSSSGWGWVIRPVRRWVCWGVHGPSQCWWAWLIRDALSSCPCDGPSSDLDMAWIRRFAVNLGINRD